MRKKTITEEEELQVESDERDDEASKVKYDIASYPSDFTLAGLTEMWKNGDITIPDFQREFVWNIKQASLLIESFLLGLPVPPVFFYVDTENKNLVIDGQQRITSIIYFFEGFFGKANEHGKRKVFKLTGLHEKNPFYNKSFKDLNEADARRLKNSVLRALNIRQLSPKNENTSVYHIFERLNTGGTPLSPQEIRNVVFRGKFVLLLKKLNKDHNWRKILGKKNIDRHQKDVELILRVFSLCNYINIYEKPMKEFLNEIMRRNKNGSTVNVTAFSKNFTKTTKLIVAKLGEKPFNIRGPLSTSALDSVFCTILNNIDRIPSNVLVRYSKLKKDKRFFEYTSAATSDEKIVKARFKYVKSKLIN